MRLVTGQKGQTLIEVLIAVALLGMLATAFLGGLFAALKADIIADERAVCQSLSQSHLEFVKSQAWDLSSPGWDNDWAYNVTTGGAKELGGLGHTPPWINEVPPVPDRYHGYYVHVIGHDIKYDANGDGSEIYADDQGLRKITVEVYRNDEPARAKLTLEGYKVKI